MPFFYFFLDVDILFYCSKIKGELENKSGFSSQGLSSTIFEFNNLSIEVVFGLRQGWVSIYIKLAFQLKKIL